MQKIDQKDRTAEGDKIGMGLSEKFKKEKIRTIFEKKK